MFSQNKGTTSLTDRSSNQDIPSQEPPAVQFGAYENNTSIFTLPANISTYKIKNNFSDEEIKAFGAILGLTEQKSGSGSDVALFNLNDLTNRGILGFNKETGAFEYESYGAFKPFGYTNQPLTTAATLLLSQLKLMDETITCGYNYKRSNIQFLTYVECHRDWTKVGGPILDLVGALNLPESKRLSALRVGLVDEDSPADETVTNLNQGLNGKARPTDFNSFTVAFYEDGSVHSINSNLRWIEQKTTTARSNFLSPQEALDNFYNGRSTFSLTLPTGAGQVEWNKVYPGNLASADVATISDFSLIYPDKNPSITHDVYEPYYLIRGTAKLDTGFTVKFAEALPATKSIEQAMFGTEATVAGVAIAQEKNLQLKTIRISPRPSGVRASTAPRSSQTTTPSSSTTSSVAPSPSGNEAEPELPYCFEPDWLFSRGSFRVRLNIGSHQYEVVNSGAQMFLYGTTNPSPVLSTVRNEIYKLVKDQYVINVAKWYQANPSELAVVSGTQDVIGKYDLMNQIDSSTFPCDQPLATGPGNPPYYPAIGAPVIACRAHNPIFETIERQVAEEIVAAKRANNISSLAGRSDTIITPDEVSRSGLSTSVRRGISLDRLHWVLQQGPGTYSTEAQKCYLTGASPSLFIYSDSESEVKINPKGPLTFADPAVGDGWRVKADMAGNLSINGTSRGNLYYEYDKSKLAFETSSEGFVVSRDNLEWFVNDLSSKMGLNQKEGNQLLNEFSNEVKTTKSYLRVSLVGQSELSSKLPLEVSPSPANLNRYHFVVEATDFPQSMVEPVINPVKRGGLTIVELGVTSRK